MSAKQLLHTLFQTNTLQGLKRALAINGYAVIDLRSPAKLWTVIDCIFDDGALALCDDFTGAFGFAQNEELDEVIWSIIDDEMLDCLDNLFV